MNERERQFSHAAVRLQQSQELFSSVGTHIVDTSEGGVLVNQAMIKGLSRVVFSFYLQTPGIEDGS